MQLGSPSSKSIFQFLISIFCAAAISGCALGPINSHETARTVGKGMHELSVGGGNAPYFFKWNYGASENLDLGLQAEMTSIGIRAKYAFINKTDGLSFAGAAGIGNSIGGSHYYGDLMLSSLFNWWEPYSTLRMVHVSNDPVELKDRETGNVFFKTDAFEYNYGQIFLGNRFWFTPKFYLSLEFSSIFALSSNLTIGGNSIVTGGLGFRF